jgi:hypothetical protein
VQRGGGGWGYIPLRRKFGGVVTVTDFPLGSSFVCKIGFIFLAKDRLSLENLGLFYCYGPNLILKLVPSDG